MRIGYICSQQGMTSFQTEEFKRLLKLKGATELVFRDYNCDVEGAEIAFDNGIEIFTIFPISQYKNRGWFRNPDRDTSRERGEFRLLPSGTRIKWMPAEHSLVAGMRVVDNCNWLIVCPKEFEHTLRSGVWAVVRYAWKHKKDKITIIPPIER